MSEYNHKGDKHRIYFDFNATTPVSSAVVTGLLEWVQYWGNPSSIHWFGRAPKNKIREARQKVAEVFNISPLEIIFTSGGSESNNLVIQGLYQQLKDQNKSPIHFITSQVEHPSVLKTMKHLESKGVLVDYISVNREGEFNLDEFKKALKPGITQLVSVMYANNETGNLFPIEQITRLAHEAGSLMHSDCVQGLGKSPIDLTQLGVDFASFSAHKFYSLKGCGFLYSKKGIPLTNLIFGGAQERQRRGGTENTLGILAFGESLKQLVNLNAKIEIMSQLLNYFESQVEIEIPKVYWTGKKALRLPNTSSMVIPGVDGETLLMSLDMRGFAVSTGAACSSGNPEPSPVLLSMGLSREEAQSSLRVSLGWTTTKEEVDLFVKNLKEVVLHLRKIEEESRGK